MAKHSVFLNVIREGWRDEISNTGQTIPFGPDPQRPKGVVTLFEDGQNLWVGVQPVDEQTKLVIKSGENQIDMPRADVPPRIAHIDTDKLGQWHKISLAEVPKAYETELEIDMREKAIDPANFQEKRYGGLER